MLPILFNWILDKLIIPLIKYLGDMNKMKATELKSKEAAKELSDAISSNSIDIAVDKLP